jgi:diguanylate cyclase (GGDEF)-like protein
MKSNLRRSLIFIPIFLLLLASYLFVARSYLTDRKSLLEASVNDLRDELLVTVNSYQFFSEMIFDMFIDTERVTGILAGGTAAENPAEKQTLRMELYHTLEPLYQKLLTYHFRQLHFHESTNLSFLRFHRLEVFGDDLTGIRDSVAYVNSERVPYAGFEEGRIFNGYRFVYPLAHAGSHIGSVEISISMQTILSRMQENFGKPTQFVLLRSLVEETVFEEEQDNYIPWQLDDRFVLDKELIPSPEALEDPLNLSLGRKDLLRIRNALTTSLASASPVSLEIPHENEKKILSLYPVTNIGGSAAGYLISISDNYPLALLKKDFIKITLVYGAILITIIFLLGYILSTQKKIDKMATLDSLTRTYNRHIFSILHEKENERYKRYGTIYSTIMLDIDFFKKVNDQHGHATGDSVLRELAELINSLIRKSDILCRYGGEEFIIMLPRTKKREAYQTAEKIRKAVESAAFAGKYTVTVSGGTADVSEEPLEKLSVVELADKRLYQAKANGRNQIVS